MDNLFKTVKRFAASTLSVITLMSAGATPVNTLATEAGLNMPSIVTTVNAADSVTYFRKYTGSSNSIVDIMKWYGVDSSYSYRKSIAILNGISNYSGTASQNSQMVRLAKSGTLIRSRTSGGSGGGGSSSAVNYTKFTNDARWRVGKTWNSSQKPLIGAQGYSGCAALCSDWAKYMYNKNPWNGSTYSSTGSIKAGDVIKMHKKGTTSQHWIIVVERYNDGTLRVLEGNWGSKIVLGNNYKISGGYLVRGSYTYQIVTGYHY